LTYGKENNLKEWQKSDEITKSIEQAAANKVVNINAAVTEENITDKILQISVTMQ